MIFRKKLAPTPIVELLSGYTFDSANAFLESKKGQESPIIVNMLTAMIIGLAVGDAARSMISEQMPQSIAKVSKDILAVDVLAWAIASLQQALYTRHREERGKNGARMAWLTSSSMAKSIKDYRLGKLDPAISEHFLARWNEFRELESPHERFGLLTYLLFTSIGYRQPMRRYPGSPPMILDLDFSLETVVVELAASKLILAAVDVYLLIAKNMTDEEDA